MEDVADVVVEISDASGVADTDKNLSRFFG